MNLPPKPLQKAKLEAGFGEEARSIAPEHEVRQVNFGSALAPRVGLEPTTIRLTAERSAN
jgi:hypothetical protein